jgi:hypothetical protein
VQGLHAAAAGPPSLEGAMNGPEAFDPCRAAGRKAAIRALASLRNPHPVGTDRYRQWRRGVADIMRSAVAASLASERDQTPERALERLRAEADTTR